MRREPKVYIPAPPNWLITFVTGVTSAWIVVQIIIWIGEYLEIALP